jgi:hypothetical protein
MNESPDSRLSHGLPRVASVINVVPAPISVLALYAEIMEEPHMVGRSQQVDAPPSSAAPLHFARAIVGFLLIIIDAADVTYFSLDL